jgi:ATP-dependent helicase/DNAse subunit B
MTELLLARAGAGKMDAVLKRLRDLKEKNPLAKIWVLLATERQINTYRDRLMGSTVFNVEFFNFYTLYHSLLAGNPQRCLEEFARAGLLRSMMEQLKPELTIFRDIALLPGFIDIVAEFIYELKQNLVTPEDFHQAAVQPKEYELALIYERYQKLLREHDVVDREGEGWLALEALNNDTRLAADVDLLLVDGYDQFNRLQANLLARLAGRVSQTLITLTNVPDRETTVGRRFLRARQRLEETHKREDVALDVYSVDAVSGAHVYDAGEGRDTHEDDDTRDRNTAAELDPNAPAPALYHLSKEIFRQHPVKHQLDEKQTAIHMIETPDIAGEVAAVLRHVKRLLLDGQTTPDDILIAVRDYATYGKYFAAQGKRYGVPLALHYGEPLKDNPAIVALLDLLALHLGDFRRRELLDVLRSPYFTFPGLPPNAADHLDALSAAHLLTGGRAAWLSALDTAAEAAPDDTPDDDERAERFRLDPALAAQLRAGLEAFFDAVTPPATGTIDVYIAWLEMLIGEDETDPDVEDAPASGFEASEGSGDAFPADTAQEAPSFEFEASEELGDVLPEETAEESLPYTLAMMRRIRTDAPPDIIARDLRAMETFKRLLHGLLTADALYESLKLRRMYTQREFLSDLTAAVNAASVRPSSASRTGRVLVTIVADARGLPHKHVIISGLAEGVFPAPVPEDPLLLDTERNRLREARIELPTQAERADEEGLFFELINQAHDSLTLTRPYLKEGDPWIESHLWRAVIAVFDGLEPKTLPIGSVVPLEEAATPPEAALAAVRQAVQPPNWLRGAYWQHIEGAIRVEAGRLSDAPHDHYSGRLRDKTLVDHVAAALDANRMWSASQLNDYGMCPYRFFAGRMLNLKPLEVPETSIDSRKLGSLYHAILETTYRTVKEKGLAIISDNQAAALEILEEAAADLLADAPKRFGFNASPLWEYEKPVLLRRLRNTIKADFEGVNAISKLTKKAARRPHLQEARFGIKGTPSVTLKAGGETLKLRGSVDRIDLTESGAVVVDYKLGSSKIGVDELRRGRNFQMLVYLEAAQKLLAAEADPAPPVEGGVFLRIGSKDEIGALHSVEHAEDIERSLEILAANLEHGRAGNFSATINKAQNGKCASFCDFAQFCRVANTHRRKREH